MKGQIVLLGLATTTTAATAFLPTNQLGRIPPAAASRTTATNTRMTTEDEDGNIISPFASDSSSAEDALNAAVATLDADGGLPSTGGPPESEELLELTFENVDLVLEEMRPYLIQDGGNVRIDEIDGPVVRLQLEGACGTCPSSTQTMKMGLERRLRERIPEIQEVVQAMPEGPELGEEQVDVVLDGVRPFLSVAGGDVNLVSITGESSLQPCITIKMTGSSASLNSVKLEIAQRLQKHFMMAGLKVEWED
mmetsp:Transcript_32951/g.72274  ORF Transcript_32951/g.72274 Transcript_32951/m.72274 type:complete len:251 (-) Transcript_32951:191-943(-)|eukprot:CAMPEP_0178502962 /NCGR_PEP_ID=MMETSP0696-20121128/17786_1 /TAXON_ID=265572 /ORGANISM="Extubocellulus spinifer, Strain CCMP396" /LENGTH=250 /DNA_ID=CAMNT_0020132059 /DNA_START=117 /DNA_END=869 /DNA_ORIENTATION=-